MVLEVGTNENKGRFLSIRQSYFYLFKAVDGWWRFVLDSDQRITEAPVTSLFVLPSFLVSFSLFS